MPSSEDNAAESAPSEGGDSQINAVASAPTAAPSAPPSLTPTVAPTAAPAATPVATAAAAGTIGLSGDRTIAEVLQAITTLQDVFGFTVEVAQKAVEEVGTDVTTAYNYILDKNLAQDGGGPIVPITNCPHIENHLCITEDELPSPFAPCSYVRPERTGGAKDDIQEDGSCPSKENWLCLHCGVVRCSRYVNGHGVAHYESTLESDPDKVGHCLTASLADLSVWCHACKAYIKDPRADVIVKKLELLKFGQSDQPNAEDEINDGNEPEPENDDERNDKGDDENSDSSDEEEDDSEDETRHVARGVPMLFGDIPDEIEYPFGEAPQSLADVAKFIKSEECQSIIVLAGAGMSVASGIPDFRSAGGLYDTLRPSLLTATEAQRETIRMDPTAALDMVVFLENPLPCLEVNRPFILGTRDQKWKATLAHRFVELLHMKSGKLTRLYQQNIDGLESQCTNLPRDKIVMVHGSMDEAECAMCKTKSDFNQFCSRVETNIKDLTEQDPKAPAISTPLACDICGYETMKPSIVLFRSSLPEEFFHNAREDLPEVDLLIVIGTSLAVAPANALVYRSPRTAMRVVVNREPVGYRLGIDYTEFSKRDYFAQGDIDRVLLDLVEELGWMEDLQQLCEHLPDQSARVLREKLQQDSSAKRLKMDEDTTAV